MIAEMDSDARELEDLCLTDLYVGAVYIVAIAGRHRMTTISCACDRHDHEGSKRRSTDEMESLGQQHHA